MWNGTHTQELFRGPERASNTQPFAEDEQYVVPMLEHGQGLPAGQKGVGVTCRNASDRVLLLAAHW